jgi:hypothetical protein
VFSYVKKSGPSIDARRDRSRVSTSRAGALAGRDCRRQLLKKRYDTTIKEERMGRSLGVSYNAVES